MITFESLSHVFERYLIVTADNGADDDYLLRLAGSAINFNMIIWNLEDEARYKENGIESIARAKEQIDINNQYRNDLIHQIDSEIFIRERVECIRPEKVYYSESPGMIIDRLSILFIKYHKIISLIEKISDQTLKKEYINKSKTVKQQIVDLGGFFDAYLNGIRAAQVYFKIYDAIKIYNDERVKPFLKLI